MFFRPRIFPMLFVGFLTLMLIGGLRQASYRNAYFDGYRAGQVAGEQAAPAAAEAPAAEAAPSVDRGPYGAPGYGYPHRHGIGFFGFLFYLFFFAFIFRMFRRMAWGSRHWNSHHFNHKWSGPDGPWNSGRNTKRNKSDDDPTGFGPTYDM